MIPQRLTCFLILPWLSHQLLNVESTAPVELAAAVAEEIRVYLRENSAAGDTAEGIWRWWLTDLRHKVDVTMVEEVLKELVHQGEISMRVLASGTTLYFGLGRRNQGQP